ncbi:MAG: 16S rRNA (cytidine(1402)-2'-O)-methyltransferase [Ignavibacteria bacterium]|nr:16S rRNA (cytidine(1402)-2'-O)-methyltransferase [Ignavibacteria bacterium]
MKKALYIVSTPIGNYNDITLRAVNVLGSVNFIICEEFKDARRLLSHLKINKELFELNEHNETEATNDLLSKIKSGNTAALISDCGTPLFSDPGHQLIKMCIANKVQIIPIPGTDSLLPALVGSGFKLDSFYYYGWLSPKKDLRRKQLLDLKKKKELIVLMETPYRLKTLLRDVVKIMGGEIRCALAYELTKPKEKFYRGKTKNVLEVAEKENLKGEFVLILNNR